MAHRWLKIRVDLISGRGQALVQPPGRVMLVPPTATFDELGLGIDLALGRWDVTRARSFRPEPVGGHGGRRRASRTAEISGERVVHDSVTLGWRFDYVYDDDARWLHACVVEDFVARAQTKGMPLIVVPIHGWGTIPDQDGHVERFDEPRAAAKPAVEQPFTPSSRPSTARMQRRRAADPGPLDLAAVRRAGATVDATALLDAIEGRDLSAALQQVGDALARAYREQANGAQVQARIATALREFEDLLRRRDWDGDDVLADEIDALLTGSERRGRTLQVDLGELADVMSSGGDEPGGYLHLDTGEVVHAFLHHSAELDDGLDDGLEDGLAEPLEDDDNLWIYIDHDGHEAWRDMAAFAEVAPKDLNGILSIAVQGKGAFTRFRRTVDELGLWSDWQVFSDDRQWGRARALLKAQGIRPI